MNSILLRLSVVLIVAGLFGSTDGRAGEERSIQRPAETPGVLAEIERATIELFRRASPSVVKITTVVPDDEPSKTQIKIGSGFFWDTAGNIVTNAHVVRDAKEIAVWFASGEQAEATLVGLTPNFDLAVVRLKVPRETPPPIRLGTSSHVKVGQLAFAIGSPFGLDQSLTAGMVSAVKRQLPTSKGRSIGNIIQTDATIHPGNSGGPLLDSSGRLIGVNTIAYSIGELGASFGFAIPVDLVRSVVPRLIRDGRIPTPGIGIIPSEETLAFRLGIEGVIIGRIRPGSPAERLQLRAVDATTGAVGDVIVGANGQQIENVFDLTEQLERRGVGQTITLDIKRDGKTLTVEVDIVDIDQKS